MGFIARRHRRFALKTAGLGAALAASLLSASAVHAEWLRAETDHFIVYGDTSEANLRRPSAMKISSLGISYSVWIG